MDTKPSVVYKKLTSTRLTGFHKGTLHPPSIIKKVKTTAGIAGREGTNFANKSRSEIDYCNEDGVKSLFLTP